MYRLLCIFVKYYLILANFKTRMLINSVTQFWFFVICKSKSSKGIYLFSFPFDFQDIIVFKPYCLCISQITKVRIKIFNLFKTNQRTIYIQFFVSIKKYFHPIALLHQKHIKLDVSSPF